MLKSPALIIASILLLCAAGYSYQSLQEVYDQASGNGEYDKFIELDSTVEYLGDLYIPYGVDVLIKGNGAIIFGTPDRAAIKVWGSRLDISNCVILGGLFGIAYDTMSTGSVTSNTVNDCDSIGIFAVAYAPPVRVEVWDNIITGCTYGFVCIEFLHPSYLGYNTVYNCDVYRYGELCPD
jgi:hypothetical protein